MTVLYYCPMCGQEVKLSVIEANKNSIIIPEHNLDCCEVDSKDICLGSFAKISRSKKAVTKRYGKNYSGMQPS